MRNRYILSPSFMDEAVPELESLAKPGWFINNPSLRNGDRQFRMSAIHKIIADFVSSWNPELDKDKMSEKVSISLLQTLVGHV